MEQNKIVIRGARENNLKNVSLDIPRNKLVVMASILLYPLLQLCC